MFSVKVDEDKAALHPEALPFIPPAIKHIWRIFHIDSIKGQIVEHIYFYQIVSKRTPPPEQRITWLDLWRSWMTVFEGRIDFCHFTNYSLILSHMINNKMHIWLRFNSFSKHEDGIRPNGGSRLMLSVNWLKSNQLSHFLKLEITGLSPLTCTLLQQRWLIGETGVELNVFSLWSLRNPSVGNCFGKH